MSDQIPPPPQPIPPPPQPVPPPPPPVSQPLPSPGAKQVTIPDRERIEWASMAGAAALVVGSFLTWAAVGPFKVAGTDGDGWLTIGAGVGAAALAWNSKWIWSAVLAALGLAVIVSKFVDLASFNDDGESFFEVTPGAGLYICGAGALVCLSTSAVQWWNNR